VNVHVHVSVRILPCLFQRICLASITFNASYFPEKKQQRGGLKVTFVANGQLSTLITQGWPAKDNTSD
jgi:hypothetical protein